MLAPEHSSLRRLLGFWDALALYVGIILGSGIFFAPAAVAGAASTPLTAALYWIAGAVIAACGAACYAECGARLPRTGGFYVHYREIWGPGLAFVAGLSALFVTFPASIAAIVLVLGSYATQLYTPLPAWFSAAVALALATVAHTVGVRAGAFTQRAISAAKVLALAALCLAAVGGAGAPSVPEAALAPSHTTWAAMLGAMVLILWTYDGWSSVNLVAGEMRHPARDFGRMVMVGTAVLAGLYILVQLSVGRLLGPAAAGSSRVVADAVQAGLPGLAFVGPLVAALVVVSTFGSASGTLMVMGRLCFAMAEDRLVPARLAAVHPRTGAPVRALLLSAALSAFYLWVGDLDDLLALFSFSAWLWYALMALTLLVMRRRRLGEPLDYTMPGATLAPYVIIVTGLALAVAMFVDNPLRSAVGAALLLAGLPLYWIWRRLRQVR